MKIHDKFVIELREVIKGYGNDPTVQDPFKFPCDYKFYEISGVAICEESFKKMKPLNDEINNVLDKIKAEIMELDYDDYDGYEGAHISPMICRDSVMKIINKHKVESKEME